VAAARNPFPNVAAVMSLNLMEKTTTVSSLKTIAAMSSPGKLCPN